MWLRAAGAFSGSRWSIQSASAARREREMKLDDFMILYRYKSKVSHYTYGGVFTLCGKERKVGWYLQAEISQRDRDECRSCLKILKREGIV